MESSYYRKYEPFFGKWTFSKLIGEGSYGKVFEIERVDKYDGEVYKAAMKAITVPQNPSEIETLRDNGMDDESVTAYFRGNVDDFKNEIKLMSKLKGESNIVSYEDHEVIQHETGIGWDILIQMELLTPLMKYIDNKKSFGRDDVIRLGIDICSALELCRKFNIIHRDIKPENIFVSASGNFKLGDFGIARTVEKTTGGLSKKGTYTYMAPEVYRGEKYGPTIDIYSLGIVLYRYLNNNRAPFLPQPPAAITYGDNSVALSRRLEGETIPAPVNADTELAAVVLKACAYNPKERYSSAAEMREDLEAIRDGKLPVYAFIPGTIIMGGAASPTSEMPLAGDKTVSLHRLSSQTSPLDKTASLAKTVPLNGISGQTQPLGGSVPLSKKNFSELGKEEVPSTTATAVADKQKKKKKAPFIIAAALLLAIGIGFTAFAMHGSSKVPAPIATGEQASQPTVTVEPTAEPTANVEPTPAVLQAKWTEWSKSLPKDVSDEQFIIEKTNFYRSRNKETKSSTSSKAPSGWTLEKTIDSGDFGAWSSWSTSPVAASSTRKVEKETRYRSKALETTTSSSSSLNGWTLTDTTYSWSDYGAWSNWSTSSVSSSDSRKVESKTQYSYRTKDTTSSTSSSLSGWTQYDSSVSYGSWSSWSDSAISQTPSNEVETRRVQATPAQTKYRYGRYTNGSKAHFNDKKGKELYGGTWRLQYSGWYTSRQAPTATNWGYTSTNNTIGTGRWNSSKKMYYWDRYVIGGKAYYWEESQTTAATYKTQYRYRTKTTTYYYYKWSDWSSYSDSYQPSSSAKEVRTRTLYRYCDRSKIPTYHYERWSDWSNWTTTPISSSSTKKVESHVFYRHKDKASKKTYIYSRWGSWSDWSETPAYKTDTTQVETQTMYRYKSR